jgi:hypothetical protein
VIKKIIVTGLLVQMFATAFSQQVFTAQYAAAHISEDLKKDADAVYRLDEAVVEVLSPSKYTEKVHQVVTILNSEGARHLQQSVWFDKFNTVDEIEVRVYNSAGKEIQKYKKKEFNIHNYYDGISLATDDKIMTLSLAAPEYPCTVDLKYAKSVNSYIDLPNWYMNNLASSVEQFRYVVKVPAGLDIRHRTINMELKPAIRDSAKQKIYTWETKNVAVNKVVSGGYKGNKYLPSVEVSPTKFEYDGYKGNFTGWTDFGQWCYSLYEEKNTFSEQRTAEIRSLVNGLTDADSKIRVLYDYLKKNMRYVSIQFGIGGFRPFTAKFVDEKKYGDCKALTNYMRNLLTIAGIKSYPALINAGYTDAPVAPEFPQNVFNHVILCVPGDKDSTWLECTSTKSDAGFLGSFTENKNALLLTESGGIMVSTPRSSYEKNELTTTNHIYLNEAGGAEVKTTINTTGGFFELLDAVSQMEASRQNELFVSYLHYKEPKELRVTSQDTSNDKHQLSLMLVYNKLFDFKAGNKYFFSKSISELNTEELATDTARKIEYVFEHPYKKIDTTIFHLPSGFTIDNLLPAKELNNDCVYYNRIAEYDTADNTIKIVSKLFLKKNIIKPADYTSVSTMFRTISKEEENKLILVKK